MWKPPNLTVKVNSPNRFTMQVGLNSKGNWPTNARTQVAVWNREWEIHDPAMFVLREITANSPKGRKSLGIREWIRALCGTWHDRDINASKNILAVGLDRLVQGSLALAREESQKADPSKYHIILMDYQMPIMDGGNASKYSNSRLISCRLSLQWWHDYGRREYQRGYARLLYQAW